MTSTCAKATARLLFLALLTLVPFVPAGALLGDDSAKKGQDSDPQEVADPAAAKMMHDAHAARATWANDFPGFSAAIDVRINGQAQQGMASISGDGEVKIDLPDGPAKKWAEEQLASIAMHSTAGAEEQYDVSFADDVLDHPLGRLIKFHGGATHSLYRIQDDVITEVHRTMGQVKFTISVTDTTRSPEGNVLPRHFNVSYWDAEDGVLVSNKDYQVSTVRIGKFDLPERRLMVSTAAGEGTKVVAKAGLNDDDRRAIRHPGSPKGRSVYELRLSDHKLLEK